MASGNPLIPITATQTVHSAAGVSIPAIRLWIELLFERRNGDFFRCDALLDTGAPLSVVPYSYHHRRDFAWQPLPGPWPVGFTTWFGVPCTVGRMQVWVAAPHAPFKVGPFTFIAKFAQAAPTRISGDLPIILGMNFLADHRGEIALRCHTPPNFGSLILP